MIQRKIAFRVYDKANKQMKYKVWAGNNDLNDDNFSESLVYNEKTGEWLNTEIDCGKIMQFTGIIDVDGKEIYEGDVIFNQQEEGIHGSNIVMFYNGKWVIEKRKESLDSPKIKGEYIDLFEICDTVSVVANIYEDPYGYLSNEAQEW